jgi:hypothetical protein
MPLRQVLIVGAAALMLSSGVAHAADRLPQSHLYTPTTGGQVEVGESVLVTGGGYDGYQADTLREYQVSVDGGETWNDGYRTATVGLGGETGVTQALWAYVFTPEEPGVYTIVGRVNTDTVNGQVSASRTLYVGLPAPPPTSCCVRDFYTENPVEDAYDGLPVELGLRFRVDRPGSVTGVNIWRNGDRAARVRLWTGDGTLLAEQVVRGGYADPFPTPVQVVPGQEYVASFTSWSGWYRTSENTFTATVIQAPFILPAHAGVYSYGDAFPTQTWNDSHYWVSPEFRAQ